MTEAHKVYACGHSTIVANKEFDITWSRAECLQCLTRYTPEERLEQDLYERYYGPESFKFLSDCRKARSRFLRQCRAYLKFFHEQAWTADPWVEDHVPISTMWFAEVLEQEHQEEGSSDLEDHLPGLDHLDSWMREMEDIVEGQHPYGWFEFCATHVASCLRSVEDEVQTLKDAVRTLHREFVHGERLSGAELKALQQMGSPGRKVLERPTNRRSISIAESLMAQSMTPVILSPEKPKKERKVRYMTRARARQKKRAAKRPAKRRLKVELDEPRRYKIGTVTPGRHHVILLDSPLTPQVLAWLQEAPAECRLERSHAEVPLS